MFSLIQILNLFPCRSKHAAVLHGQFLYLLGGRNGNVPMKDFWKYNIGEFPLKTFKNANEYSNFPSI